MKDRITERGDSGRERDPSFTHWVTPQMATTTDVGLGRSQEQVLGPQAVAWARWHGPSSQALRRKLDGKWAPGLERVSTWDTVACRQYLCLLYHSAISSIKLITQVTRGDLPTPNLEKHNQKNNNLYIILVQHFKNVI